MDLIEKQMDNLYQVEGQKELKLAHTILMVSSLLNDTYVELGHIKIKPNLYFTIYPKSKIPRMCTILTRTHTKIKDFVNIGVDFTADRILDDLSEGSLLIAINQEPNKDDYHLLTDLFDYHKEFSYQTRINEKSIKEPYLNSILYTNNLSDIPLFYLSRSININLHDNYNKLPCPLYPAKHELKDDIKEVSNLQGKFEFDDLSYIDQIYSVLDEPRDHIKLYKLGAIKAASSLRMTIINEDVDWAYDVVKIGKRGG